MPPDPPPGPWAASPALPLHVESGSLLAGGPQGAPLLAGFDPCASVRPGEGQSVVLGLACASSSVALADCALGQVRGGRGGRRAVGWGHGSRLCCIPNTIYPQQTLCSIAATPAIQAAVPSRQPCPTDQPLRS